MTNNEITASAVARRLISQQCTCVLRWLMQIGHKCTKPSSFRKLIQNGLITLTFLLLSGPLLEAQDSTAFRPALYLGAQYGLSWNDVRFSPTVNQEIYSGSRYGLVARYLEAPHVGVQLEVSVDQRGWSEKRDTFPSLFTQKVDYVDVSLYSHFAIGNSRLQPIILLGSFISFPTADERELPTDWTITVPSYYEEPFDRRLQYGLAGGLGIALDLGPVIWQLNGRYRYALSNLFAGGEGSLFTFSQGKGFMVLSSLQFRL